MSYQSEPGPPAEAAGAGPGPGEAYPVKSRKHKVVIESFTQEKKKLRTTLSFTAKPPPGYTFIPAGHPELTAALKEFSRKGNHQIYAVSTTRHQETHDLSKEVHRIGFHFPTPVVDEVCAHYGISLSASGTLIKEEDRQTFHRRRQGRNQRPDDMKDQVTINTEARDALKDLFPNIPDNDLHQIIKTAFQKGQKKVGTANELPLIRRAQLSVVAHVRHMYTKYDSLLRRVQWNEARNMVEGPTLRKLVEWRGDDDNGKEALEDVLREVVVISDDEGSEEESNEVEVMPIDYAQNAAANGRDTHDLSEDEAPEGFRYVPQLERRRAVVDSAAANRRINRFDAWDKAREQFRANPTYVTERVIPDQRASFKEVVEFDRPYVSVLAPKPVIPTGMQAVRRSPPEAFRAADGMYYRRMMTIQSDTSHPPPRRTPPPRQRLAISVPDPQRSQYVQSDRPAPKLYTDQLYEGDKYVLPSIEGQEQQKTVQHNPFAGTHPSHSQAHPLGGGPRSPRVRREGVPREYDIVDLTSPEDHQDAKRRRIENSYSETSVHRRHEPIEHLSANEARYVPMTPARLDRPSGYRQYPLADPAEQGHISKSAPPRRGLEPVHQMRMPPTVPVLGDVTGTRPLEVPRRADEIYHSPSGRMNSAVAPRLSSLRSTQSYPDAAHRRTSFVPSNYVERVPLHHDRVQTILPLEVIPPVREVHDFRAVYASGEVTSTRRQPPTEPVPERSVEAFNGSSDVTRPLKQVRTVRYRDPPPLPREIVEYVEPDGTVREYVSAGRPLPTYRRVPIEVGEGERPRQTQEYLLPTEEVSSPTASRTYRRLEKLPPATYVRN